jgi:hypothetical protein
MYVRKKKNRSGTISVVVVSKSSGKYEEIKSFGTTNGAKDAENLCDATQRRLVPTPVNKHSTLMTIKGGNRKKPNV